ncbi:methylated-DNA--[protein]-cysteine S-methyltransferase [Nitrospirillum viridazoti]|uniref:Cysteine methyltransferase n=1 Tax=Nitrospirillum viridazoti CBAmc TaxID=1441467 RepID=A0A248JRQ4_9PROT|nr:methylated-DNA--[protein]-cysteine S-methyltransferase [Nitrospirillum amazonense]ASG21216.1 cysteine methyltransferase [Nitrospirillum amazonense CBAmc]TWB32209.1 methylated-DNA-[protein]-cysteine S-methyltransferase [Nitrospirillum amazonense]
MTVRAHILFDTAIGVCALVWGPDGIVGAQLPEGGPEQAEARLARRFPGAVAAAEHDLPPVISEARVRIRALMAGEAVDIADIPLDLAGLDPFALKVYAVTRAIPRGETLTYGTVAGRIGAPKEAARAVGQALGNNPIPILIPCHRVLAAGGGTGGFSARGGIDTKFRILAIEQARTEDEPPSLFDQLPLAIKPQALKTGR